MKKWVQENKMMLLFLFTSVINEILLRVTSTGGFLLRPILGDLFFLLLVCSVGYLINHKHVYYLVWSIVLTGICYVNSAYFNQYHEFVSVYLVETLFQAFMMPSEAVTDVFEIKDFIFLWQSVVMVIAFILLKKQYHSSKKYALRTGMIAISILVILCLSCNSNDIYRLTHNWNKEYVVRHFGVYSYQLQDIVSAVGNVFWKGDRNKAKQAVTDYYAQKEETKDNVYTNIFQGKNLLFIHAESIQSMFIDDVFAGKELMPNLKRIRDEGLYFSNFYSQESVGTSSDTEFIINTSVLPIGKGTVFVNYAKNHYVAAPNILSTMGYTTFSMHGNVCEFWKRDIMYQHLGYQHFYCGEDFDASEKVGLGVSDKSFFHQSVKYLQEIKQPFYGPLIMLSNHTPFYTNELVDDYPVGALKDTKMGRYLQMMHYADQAIGQLFSELESAGLLDNTVVVIYGDHDSKLKVEEYQRYLGTTDDIDFYEYESFTKVPLIIWSKDQEVHGTVDTVMGVLDVLPTLGNMFGYGSPYALGNDIFSVEDNIVVFPNGNFVTDKVYVNNQMGTKYEFSKVTEEYIAKHEKQARKIVEISNNLIKYDLFD